MSTTIKCGMIAALTATAGAMIGLAIPNIPDSILYVKDDKGHVIKDRSTMLAVGAGAATLVVIGAFAYLASREKGVVKL